MRTRLNDLGQPIGPALPDWKPVPRPPRTTMEGRRCRVEPIDPGRHGDDLFAAFAADRDGGTFKDRFGAIRVNPAAALERDYRALGDRCLRQLAAMLEG